MEPSQPATGRGGRHTAGRGRGGPARTPGPSNSTSTPNESPSKSSSPKRGNRSRGGGKRSDGPPRLNFGAKLTPSHAEYTTVNAKGQDSSPAPTLHADMTSEIAEVGRSRSESVGTRDDGEICFICASEVVHSAITPCNHRTCHICALRMRALYKTKVCAHCRAQADFIVLSDDFEKRYESFVESDFSNVDSNLGIKYDKQEIFEDIELLLRYNCPDPGCDVACLGWPDLRRHVRKSHQKLMCDFCTRNKKVFTHEHELFNHQELRRHERFGDDSPGAIDQSGFKGHPECGFCRTRFYGSDELYIHCRDKHERCHICDRQNQTRQPQYFQDYPALEEHFANAHFPCLHPACVEKKFVVFDTEMDLKAHQLESHPDDLSKDVRRDTRRVAMSTFNFREAHEPQRSARRDRTRGRHPDADPVPQSSAQPLRRDELAYQRQLAIQSAQSTDTRTFGSQLSRPAQAQERPSESRASIGADFNAIQSSRVEAAPQANMTPQEQARRLRHQAVIERASSLLANDPTKLDEFRGKISAFKNSSISAEQLIDSFFTLFDTSPADLGKLVKELAEIFEIPAKRESLLRSWADWRAINEDYPALPGPNGLPAGSLASSVGSGGTRVLRLKQSTARSSRSAQSKQNTWNGRAVAQTAFPALPSRSTQHIHVFSGPSFTPTAGATSASSRVTSTTAPRARNAPQQSAGSSEAFPALPPAAKPTSTLFNPGYGGAAVRRVNNDPSVSASAWGANSGQTEVPQDIGNADAPPKRKGNKNKKQTLFHFG